MQAGAGIVNDSVPEKEFMETKNKALAVVNAVKEAARVMILMIDNYDSFTYNGISVHWIFVSTDSGCKKR